MITVSRGRLGPTAARVFEEIRGGVALTRDEIVAGTGLSVATVGRTVGQLVSARILRERPDLATVGRNGRPGTPVEPDPTAYVVVGVHLGRRITTVALADLTGRVVAQQTAEHPPAAGPDLDEISRLAAELLGSLPGRSPLSLGLVAPWGELDLDPARVAAELHELTGLDVRYADHIAAVAATEFLNRRRGTGGVTLYVYARDTLGFAVAVDKGAQTEVSRVGSLTHFPTGSGAACPCGRTGCLQVTAGDEALARTAYDAGLVAEPEIESVHRAQEDPRVLALVRERATVLGQAVGQVRDMIAPDRVVLVGQAFTGWPPVLVDVVAAAERFAPAGAVPISFTRFGAGIQAAAASTIGLGRIYDDPLAAVPTLTRSARATRPAATARRVS